MVCYTHIEKVSAMALAVSFLEKNIQNSIKIGLLTPRIAIFISI